MDIKDSAASRSDVPKGHRQRIRDNVSKYFDSFSGRLKDTKDMTSTADSASQISENASDGGEEGQPNTDIDRQDSDTEYDMWAEAEKKLRKDDKKRHNLEEYNQILEAHFGDKLEPIGTQTRYNQFYKFLDLEVEKLHRAKTKMAPDGENAKERPNDALKRPPKSLCRNNTGERNKETYAAFTDACCNIIEFPAKVLCFLQTNPVASVIRNMFEWEEWNKLLSEAGTRS